MEIKGSDFRENDDALELEANRYRDFRFILDNKARFWRWMLWQPFFHLEFVIRNSRVFWN